MKMHISKFKIKDNTIACPKAIKFKIVMTGEPKNETMKVNYHKFENKIKKTDSVK